MNRGVNINKAVFLDRDGVINKIVFHKKVGNGTKPSSPWKIEEFEFIPEIRKPLKRLSDLGFLLFIITNQPDISRNFIKKGTIEKINKKIFNHLPFIKEIVTCPHDDIDNCDCRKPKPGMIIDLSKKWNIDIRESWLIGDGEKDIKTGKSAGCKNILIKNEYNKNIEANHKVKSIKDAVNIIESKVGEKI